jgi:hypothetical protein
MEYNAQLKFIDEYRADGWEIIETLPRIPQPLIYKQYGKPLVSKTVSEVLYRLQQHNFNFVDDE